MNIGLGEKRKTILLIDADPHARAVLRVALEAADFDPLSNMRLRMQAPVCDARPSKRLARDVNGAKAIRVNLRALEPSFKRELMNRVDSGLRGRL